MKMSMYFTKTVEFRGWEEVPKVSPAQQHHIAGTLWTWRWSSLEGESEFGAENPQSFRMCNACSRLCLGAPL